MERSRSSTTAPLHNAADQTKSGPIIDAWMHLQDCSRDIKRVTRQAAAAIVAALTKVPEMAPDFSIRDDAFTTIIFLSVCHTAR